MAPILGQDALRRGKVTYNTNYGNLLFLWDVVFGSAHFTRRYPPAYGLTDDRAHGPEPWQAQFVFPLRRSRRAQTVLGAGAHAPPPDGAGPALQVFADNAPASQRQSALAGSSKPAIAVKWFAPLCASSSERLPACCHAA